MSKCGTWGLNTRVTPSLNKEIGALLKDFINKTNPAGWALLELLHGP